MSSFHVWRVSICTWSCAGNNGEERRETLRHYRSKSSYILYNRPRERVVKKASGDLIFPDRSSASWFLCVFTLICLFIVMQKSMMKYITSIGQNTGTLKTSKNVQTMAMTMPFVAECLQGEATPVRTTTWWQIPMSCAQGDEGQQGGNSGWEAQRQEKFTGPTRTWILATFWWKGETPRSAWWEGLDPHLQERWSNTAIHWSLFTLHYIQLS